MAMGTWPVLGCKSSSLHSILNKLTMEIIFLSSDYGSCFNPWRSLVTWDITSTIIWFRLHRTPTRSNLCSKMWNIWSNSLLLVPRPMSRCRNCSDYYTRHSWAPSKGENQKADFFPFFCLFLFTPPLSRHKHGSYYHIKIVAVPLSQ